MALDIALSRSQQYTEVWRQQPVREPEEAASSIHAQQPSANDLYQRYLQGKKDTPFERVFNKALREIDANPPEAPAPWLALGQWAVMNGRFPMRTYNVPCMLMADVEYFIDPVESLNTERDIIEAMVLARGRGAVLKHGRPNLMGRRLLLKMPESEGAARLHGCIMDGGRIAVRSLWGLGAQVYHPSHSKRLQRARK